MAETLEDGLQVLLQRCHRLGMLLHECPAASPAGERLQPIAAGTGEEVEDSGPFHPVAKAGKDRLAHAVGGRPDMAALAGRQRNAAGLSAGDAHGPEHAASIRTGKRAENLPPF